MRPELAGAFQLDGRIAIDNLLNPAAHPPSGPFLPPSPNSEPESRNSKPQTPNSEPETRNPKLETLQLGDLLATLLRWFGIDALVALLQRRGLLGHCQCAARQSRLNALTPRLRAQLQPWSLTVAVLLAWFLFAVVLLVR